MTNDKFSITLNQIGRRFNRDWIFRGIDHIFTTGETYAILGPNGSGKSTLLQILNGSLSPSKGTINYFNNDQLLEAGSVFEHLSLAAPYLEIIEEFTLDEMIDFHFKFKSYKQGMGKEEILELLSLPKARHKAIRYFSSG